MMKKGLAALLGAAVLMSSMTGMTAFAEESTGEAMVASYLTGQQVPESIGRKRPVALMIENDSAAVPWQHGTSSASIMYEAMVEGAITRMMGIFEDYQDTSMIMPIRSSRPYYVFYAKEFNAFYGHFGQVVYAVPVLQLSSNFDLAGLPYGEDGLDYKLNDASSAYVRDHDDVTGIYTNYELLHNYMESAEWSQDYSEYYDGHYQFAADGEEVNLEKGQVANVVLPGFTYNHARFDYNSTDKLYYRSEFGDAQIDQENGQQLAYKNIIIQECPSTMLDEHYLWTDPVNNGEQGSGWFITNGRAEKITWQKENYNPDEEVLTTVSSINTAFDVRDCDFNKTRYYDMNGNEIVLNQGKTFVEIVRNQDAGKVVITDNPNVDSYVIDSLE